jgi:hypothetical protein
VTVTAAPAGGGSAAAITASARGAAGDRYVVSIDGGKGVAGKPGDVYPVEPGEHTVLVRSPETGYTEYKATFSVKADETAAVNADLRMMWGTSGTP